MAAATNFIFGVYIHYNEYYRKMQYQETKGAWRMIRFWDPSTSLGPLHIFGYAEATAFKFGVQIKD